LVGSLLFIIFKPITSLPMYMRWVMAD